MSMTSFPVRRKGRRPSGELVALSVVAFCRVYTLKCSYWEHFCSNQHNMSSYKYVLQIERREVVRKVFIVPKIYITAWPVSVCLITLK